MLKYRIILPILLCLILFVTGGCGAQERNAEISGDEEVIAQKESEDVFSKDTDNSDITGEPDQSDINAIEENDDSLKNDNVTTESHTTPLKEQKAGDDLQSYADVPDSSDSVIASVTPDNDTADSVVADSDSADSVYVADRKNDHVNTRKTRKYVNAKKDKTKKKYNKDANGEKTGTDHSGKNNSDGTEGNGKGDNGSKKGNQNTTQSSDNSNGNNGTDDNEGQIVLEEDNGIKTGENGDILLPEAP